MSCSCLTPEKKNKALIGGILFTADAFEMQNTLCQSKQLYPES
jgi:hypothetical protein